MANMKKIFVDTFIDMLNKKPLDTITVTDIVAECGVSRQSFYYYFDDIYSVAELVFKEETEKALKEYSDIDSWDIGFIRIMKWAQNNKKMVMNTYKSIRRDYVEYFMNNVLYQYIIKVVMEQAEGILVTKEQCEFIANFYTLSLNAITLDWIHNNMEEKPEIIAEKVKILLIGDFKKALLNFEKENIK